MSKPVTDEKSNTVAVCKVERRGEAIILPKKMETKTAIEVLERHLKYDEETVQIKEVIPGFFLDACHAFQLAVVDMFGWSFAEKRVTQSLFGQTVRVPEMITIETGWGETTAVPFGDFSVPSLAGTLTTEVHQDDNKPVQLQLVAKVQRKDEARVRALYARTRQFLATHSIYRAKAFKVQFRDDDGDRLPVPEPKFLDLTDVRPEELIFDRATDEAVRTNLFTPLEQSQACREARIPLKRGLLFPGPYGCGKTLVAYVTAKKAVESGWTFIYCERASELREYVNLAQQYQPAVVFCEDIDRVMTGERTVAIDDLLNTIDGIESKSTEIMVVLTTNHLEKIHRAMLRPGRLDAVIPITPPDQESAERLIRQYARDLLRGDSETQHMYITEAAQRMAGQIPAVIREMVERAKLSAIKLTGKPILTGEALLDAATAMQRQLALLEEKSSEAATPGEHIAYGIHGVLRRAFPGVVKAVGDPE